MAQFLIGFAAGGLVGTFVGVVLMALAAAAGRPAPEDSKARLAQSPYFKDMRITNDDIRAELGLPPEQRRANDN